MRRAAIALSLLLPLLVPSTAHATGTGEPQILSPSADQVVLQGWTGPLRIDFSDAATGTYDVWVECPPGEGDGVPVDDYFWSQKVTYDGTDDVFETDLPPLTTLTAQKCLVSVYPAGAGPGAQQAFQGFTVAAARLTIGSVTAAPRVFYPRVVDGFRDLTVVRWQTSRPAAARGRVKDSSGRTIRYVNLGRIVGSGVWLWRGGRDDGRLAAAGRYQMEVSVTDLELGTVRRASTPVRVATGVRTRHSVREVTGDRMTGSSRAGACSFARDAGAGTAALRCTGSGYVQAWWRFPVQPSARALRAEVAGRTAGGTVTRQLQRIGPRSARVGLRVTGAGGFTVERVRLSWDWVQHL